MLTSLRIDSFPRKKILAQISELWSTLRKYLCMRLLYIFIPFFIALKIVLFSN